MHWNSSFKSILSILLLLFVGGVADATIQRVDFCGGQFTATQAVPIVKTKGNVVTVRGDLVDTITGVTAPSGIAVTIGNKTGGGGTNTSVQLTITPGSGVTTGNKDIKLNYAVELGAKDIFKINVKAPQISSITVAPNSTNVAKGSPVTVSVSGTGLHDLRLSASPQSHFSSFQNTTINNDTTYAFSGNLQSNVTFNIGSFFDSIISASGLNCASATGSGGLTLNVGAPDLVPTKPTGLYKLGATEACGSGPFATTKASLCDRLAAPTAANPHVEGVVDVGPIIYVVKNTSSFPMPNQTFKVQLKFGINILAEDIVQPLAPGAQKVLTFGRATNRRKLMRDFNCTSCYDLNQAPLNWTDGQFTVVVDVDNQIAESNESNNSVVSD